jgi:hypothetical protein
VNPGAALATRLEAQDCELLNQEFDGLSAARRPERPPLKLIGCEHLNGCGQSLRIYPRATFSHWIRFVSNIWRCSSSLVIGLAAN